MRHSLTHPVHVYEGDDALITCVVRDIRNNSVMWKKEDRERHSRRVLTAGDTRVTADKRFTVLHDAETTESTNGGDGGGGSVPNGGDVWVLVIKNSKPVDSGIYVCEVNSNPIVRSFHKLSVLSKALLPPDNSTDVPFMDEQKPTANGRNHNYTNCCIEKSVSSNCLGFCNIQSILEGSTGQDPEHCERDFPAIVKCMADGRNHVPCCIQERVPDICQDVCRGEYTVITENIKTHFSCSAYTEQTLACIVEGIELLPSPPANVEVEPINESSLRVSWLLPQANTESITEYAINVTSLKSFDSHLLDANNDSEEETKAINWFMTHTVRLDVPSTNNFTIINDLLPYTMYEVTVTTINKHGSSLPSYAVRSLTLTPQKIAQTEVPKLPDVKACCANKGIGHKTCVNKLCDPTLIETVEITDLMICAPWAADTFSCLTNGIDHSPCCSARGLPALCQQLCTGNVTTIDFNYFKCLRYMSDYTNCLMQGYGVLPSAPTHVHVTNIDTIFALIHWGAPTTLGDTVQKYIIRYREFVDYDNDYQSAHGVKSPYILEGLQTDTPYEFYIEAVNTHGIGMASARITFKTLSYLVEEKIEEASNYNVTDCCVKAELMNVCMPLCSYDANMTDIKLLAGVCGDEFHKLLRCGAGGRNHGACCSRRGVPPACLSLCSGVIADNLLLTATTCIPYIGNIAQCFEEGTQLIPGPISELHATVTEDTSIELQWEAPVEGNNVTGYVIHYRKVDNTSMHETLPKLDNEKHVNETFTILSDLEPRETYQLFVVSQNEHGTSIPSSMILITAKKTNGEIVDGVTSPPHSLAVASHSATWVSVTWQPPEFSHPAELITYKLYHKSTVDEAFHVRNTTITSEMLENLNPNTQYIIYVTAISKKGASLPSETLIAWTDPAYPAFVEPPTVHPINLVIEGSSMTILCIAMGTPMPTISLYISGRLVRQETTRHMVTVIHNVTRDMSQISCYADNGYGMPMQASRKITISHGPHIQASGITMAALGDSVTLECRVDAQPEPKMFFWKDHEKRTPVIQGGKYEISIQNAKDEDEKYIMQMKIHSITDLDVGDYYCHAENAFGNSTQPVSVRIRNVAATNNVTQCCMEQNVSSACFDACSFYLDIDAVIDKPECISEFDKLMKCAADGSDHRNCCAQRGVPRRCLEWCRGEPHHNKRLCVLSYTKDIIHCFHEGRDKLPGPPQNVQAKPLDEHSVQLTWDPPIKNPNKVEMYRVFWRLAFNENDKIVSKGGSQQKIDTPLTSLQVNELKEGKTYEFLLISGNHHGLSTLTDPVRVTMGDKYITSSASTEGDSSHTGVAVAVCLALLIVAIIVVVAFWFVRTKRMLGVKNQGGGVAFENPSYLREVNMDHIQIPSNQASDSTTSTTSITTNGAPSAVGNGMSVSSVSGASWRQEPLHVPAAQEVNPTLYEELKLGQDGAGFKRLKP